MLRCKVNSFVTLNECAPHQFHCQQHTALCVVVQIISSPPASFQCDQWTVGVLIGQEPTAVDQNSTSFLIIDVLMRIQRCHVYWFG
jgi:hypothetical protein